MSVSRLACSVVLALALSAMPAHTSSLVPFQGTWGGSTVSAEPVDDNTVLVVASGTGQASQLGAFSMTSPHLTYLDTFVVEGTQQFVAANGDRLNATISGQLLSNADGNLEGTLAGVITGGTGRFKGATGVYSFHIVAVPAAFGFDSTAAFSGVISSPGWQ